MSAELEFVLGRSGTGKTAALFSRVAQRKREGGEIFVIVPDQESFETERRLSHALSGGLMGVTVTSWSGLARRELDSLGDRRAFLSDQGRVMLIRRSVDACSKDLTVFRRSAAHSGFPAEADELIKRFKRCGMDARGISEAAERLDDGLPLRDKLHDIALILSELERRTQDRYIDSEDMMNELIRRLGESSLCGAHVFIDGGATVTEQSFPMFAALLDRAASICCALNYDDSPRGRALFFPEARIFERLADMAREAGVSFAVTRLSERKRPRTPAIEHLESELFAYPAKVFEGEPEGLSISFSADARDEVSEAAECIRSAAAQGMRYRDMTVIISDLDAYSPIVSRIFPEYGIPYFTDAKRSLITHPIAQLILSALRAAESGFYIDSIRELVKSGFFDIGDDEAERFENFILARGIYGARLTEAFADGDAEFEPARQKLMTPLLHLRENVREGGCESRARAIHAFMEELDLYGRQRALCDSLHEKGLYREEEENAQVINTVLEVLDQLYVIMGDERIGLKRFILVAAEGFSAYEVGVIPTTCDQVLVGSVDRTRSREVRLLIVLGMSDGLFPRPRRDAGVIDDGDLAALKSMGLELWQSSRALAESDLLTVYSALSKATERIVFSCPLAVAGSAEDASALPCRLIGAIREIFPLIPVFDHSAEAGFRSSERAAFAALAKKLRRMLDTGVPDPEAAVLYSYFLHSPAHREALKSLTSQCFGQEPLAPFGHELSQKLYGGRLYGSASRLEDFNKCPFLHFARYGLCAQPRKERTMRATDKGTFRHAVLEAYVRYIMDNDIDWRDIDDERTFAILREIVPPIMTAEGSGVLYDTARQRAELVGMIESIKITCCVLTRQIAAGSFRPAGCEVSFGRKESPFPPLVIETPSGASFRISGVIDRIDSFESARGDALSRIIDYKSGGKDFKFGHLAAGLQLQLPLYAAAVEAARTVGMFYMPVMDVSPTTLEEGDAERLLTEELIREFRLNGICLRDEEVVAATDDFEKTSAVIKARRSKDGELSGSGFVDPDEYRMVIETARRRAAASLERIMEGDFDARPFISAVNKKECACTYCDYKDICRFDAELSKGGYKKVYPMSADGFFGRVKE